MDYKKQAYSSNHIIHMYFDSDMDIRNWQIIQ